MPIIKSYFLNFQKHIKNLQQALASFGIKMDKWQKVNWKPIAMLLVLIECLINGLMLLDLYVCFFCFDFFFYKGAGG